MFAYYKLIEKDGDFPDYIDLAQSFEEEYKLYSEEASYQIEKRIRKHETKTD